MTREEVDYWMKNYPKEAESIITLCEVFDDIKNDDAAKAVLDYVIGLLRKKEKGSFIELPVPIETQVWEFEELWSGYGDHVERPEIISLPIEVNLVYHLENWGNTVFATKEEAEARIKELRGEK